MARNALVLDHIDHILSVVGDRGYFFDTLKLETLHKLEEEIVLAPECMVKWK